MFAIKDVYGTPTLIAVDENKNIIPVQANSAGALRVAGSISSRKNKLVHIEELDLNIARIEYTLNYEYDEIGIMIDNLAEITIQIDENILRVRQSLSIDVSSDSVVISNGIQDNKIAQIIMTKNIE